MCALGMLIVGALAFGTAPLALAEPPSKSPPKPSPAASASASTAPSAIAHASTIVHVATDIVRSLGRLPSGALVAVSPLTADIPAPKGDELAMRVATQVAGQLETARVHPQPVTLPAARAASGRAASLVHLQLDISKGELRVAADLYPSVSNAWERLRNPVPGPRAHAFSGAPIDAEVRTFLKPIVLEEAKIHKAKLEEAEVLAIGCGDLDSDGGNELIVATRTRVIVGKLRGGLFTVVRATPWTELASRVPVPFREPAASVVVSRHRSELLVGTTERGGVAVDASLVARRSLSGLPIPGAEEACALPSPELGAFEGGGVACTSPATGQPASVLASPAPRFDAIAALDLVGKDGALARVVAAREPSGKLRLRRTDASGKAQEAPIDGAGAQIALADLDLDGIAEVAVSGDTPDADVLTVYSWRPNGLVQRLRYPAKEGVRAVTACPPEERGVPALAAVVGGEVWLVR